MPTKIALNNLVENLKSSLHSYWQIRAANAAMLYFSHSKIWTGLPLEFSNIPPTAEIPLPHKVAVGDALHEIQCYVRDGRAATDFFLALISHFESFLSAVLRAKGLSTEGTLGNLISRAEVAYSITPSFHTELVAEIRERRNAIIHHHGSATPRYMVVAAAASLPLFIRTVV